MNLWTFYVSCNKNNLRSIPAYVSDVPNGCFLNLLDTNFRILYRDRHNYKLLTFIKKIIVTFLFKFTFLWLSLVMFSWLISLGWITVDQVNSATFYDCSRYTLWINSKVGLYEASHLYKAVPNLELGTLKVYLSLTLNYHHR